MAQSEDPWVERKQSFQERDVKKTLVGFANSVKEGATAILFVGASDTGEHPGVTDAEDTMKKIAGVAQDTCYPPIEYQACVLPVEVGGSSKEIVAVMVPFSKLRPHFAGAAYVRLGPETKQASAAVYDELIASRNDKACRILQYKGQRVWLRLESNSGFTRELESVVERCDGHSVCARDHRSLIHSFPLSKIELRQTPLRPLEILAVPPGAEEDHVRDIIRDWCEGRPAPEAFEYDLQQDRRVAQMLTKPGVVLPVIAALADGSSNIWLQLLLVHIRFAIRKRDNPLTPDQKRRRLHELHQSVLGRIGERGMGFGSGPQLVGEVDAVLELATSLDEANSFLESVVAKNPPDAQQYQRRLLREKLGLFTPES